MKVQKKNSKQEIFWLRFQVTPKIIDKTIYEKCNEGHKNTKNYEKSSELYQINDFFLIQRNFVSKILDFSS